MKCSQLITYLEKLKEKHGDLEVKVEDYSDEVQYLFTHNVEEDSIIVTNVPEYNTCVDWSPKPVPLYFLILSSSTGDEPNFEPLFIDDKSNEKDKN